MEDLAETEPVMKEGSKIREDVGTESTQREQAGRIWAPGGRPGWLEHGEPGRRGQR